MRSKYRKIYVEWWNIKRSTIYRLLGFLVVIAVLGGVFWFLWEKNFFLPAPEINDIPKDAARLVSFEGDVRIIRAATRETILVTREIFVSAGDTIQTQGDGRAQIRMIDGSTYSIRPNSTVVISNSSSLFGGTNVRVALNNGQINVKTQDQPENTENVVEVREAQNRLFPQTDASFKINSKTDSGEIRISRGGVETTIDGEKTVIKQDEFAAVNNAKISPKERVIEAPKLLTPPNSEQFTVAADGFSDVSFRWQKTDSVALAAFHLQIARSPFFVPDALVLERDTLTSPNFTLGNLMPGTYYWRIRASAVSGQISDWSELSKFSIVKQSTKEPISVTDWKVEKVGGNIFLITGKTQSGAVVGVAERETFATGDGSFRLQIAANSAEIVVGISDEKGNRSSYRLNLNTAKATRQN